MAKGLCAVIAVKDGVKSILRKGKSWKYNMDLSNDFYMNRVIGDDLTSLITTLKNNNKVFITKIETYVSDRGHVLISDMYGLYNENSYCCFIKNNKNEIKLMTIPSKRPSEFAAIGHNALNQCIVPVIITVRDGKYIGINIT